MIEVVVSRLGVEPGSQSYVIVLQEKGGARLLPIWIGQSEAESIVMHMHQMKRSRPLTHDLCKSVIQAMGVTLKRVQITRVEKNTYYAELHLERAGTVVVVDARPSDSIAIGLRMDAPIFAADELLMTAEEEAEQSTSEPNLASSGDAELTAEQLKEYLEQLRPEDFGKFIP